VLPHAGTGALVPFVPFPQWKYQDLPTSAGIKPRLRLPPNWTVPLALVAGVAAIAWRLVSDSAPFSVPALLHNLVWPGAAVALAIYLFAWLGWALDID
jgi:hypothetical protein